MRVLVGYLLIAMVTNADCSGAIDPSRDRRESAHRMVPSTTNGPVVPPLGRTPPIDDSPITCQPGNRPTEDDIRV